MSTTRAATKLEEQLALVLAKMDEQGQQLRDLAQQQAERLDGVAARQTETEGQVANLQEDLRGVKELVHERLRVAEEKLLELDSSHGELAARQKALKDEVCSEVMGRSGESGRSSGLRATAMPFEPLDGDAGDEGGAARVSMQQRPITYDGKGTWDAYQAQFELLATMNRWGDTQKAVYLAISLRGPAVTVLTNLPPEQRRDYAALSKALENRFGSAHQTELNRSRLKSRTRRRDESLPELAEDIERLTRLAYPDAPESMVDVLARDQLVDALPDDDTRLRIRQSRPDSLRQALQVALELESHQLASRQRQKVVREVRLDGETCDTEVRQPGTAIPPGGELIQQLVEALKQCALDRNGPRRGRTAGRDCGAANRESLVCWSCNQRGHLRRECKQKRTASGTEDRTSRGGTAASPQPSGNEQ